MLSLVLRVRDEEEVVPELHTQLQAFLTALHLDAEVIFVDDGSRDLSFQMLRGIAAVEPRYRILSFSRSFGQESAIAAGIEHARGQAVVVMDAGLQAPPEAVLEMVAKWREGYDVVYGKRLTRPDESGLKQLAAKAFYRLLAALVPIEIPLDAGDFRLMSRRVIVALRALKESHRFVRGLVSWIGFKQTAVLYDRPARGPALRNVLRVTLDGVLSFSTVPLRAAVFLGLLFSVLALFVLLWALSVQDPAPGWTTLVVIVSLFSSVQLVTLGVLGAYVGRIYEQIKQRPLYVVRERVNLGDKDDDVLDDAAPAQKPASQAHTSTLSGGTMMGMTPPHFPPIETVPIPVIAPIPPMPGMKGPPASSASSAVLRTAPMRAAPAPAPSTEAPAERTSAVPLSPPAPSPPTPPARESAPPPRASVPPSPPSAPGSRPSSSRSVPPPLPSPRKKGDA